MTLEELMADIPLSAGQAAHQGTSFVPERRGEYEQRSYAEGMLADYQALVTLADTDEKKAMLEVEFARYRDGCKRRRLAYLHSRSRCLSPMITGPARFPVSSNEKRNRSADNRYQELREYRERALKAIRSKLQPEWQPIRSGDADAVERLEDEIAKAKRAQEMMKSVNAAIRKHFKDGKEAQVAAIVAIGVSEAMAGRLMEPDYMGAVGFPSYKLTNNNANIRRMEARLATVKRNKSTPDTEVKGETVTVQDCPSNNRIRLFFPGKPSESVRSNLKSRGFRWTPTIGCWQAYRNSTAMQFAKEFVEATA